jgi:hypothetical protein
MGARIKLESGQQTPTLPRLLSYPPAQPSQWSVDFRAIQEKLQGSIPIRWLRALKAVLFLATLSATAHSALAQGQAQPQTLDHTLASLHGIVRNAVTSEGVPRALVRVEGDVATGALTDGDGRFSISNLPVGPQQVTVEKPGFLDMQFLAAGAADAMSQFLFLTAGGGHNVMVAADMQDVVFTLSPTGSIRGQVELSTGDSAQGITLSLARRVIQQGRTAWQSIFVTKVQSDGSFRFGGLADGDYALYSAPAMDSDLDEPTGPAGAGQRFGFAAYYYPDAREPSGLSAIHVANGQQAQANLTLSLEPFQPVNATVAFPQGVVAGMGMEFSVVVTDSAGRQLPYQAQYDADSHMIHAELPEGNYTLLVTGNPQHFRGGESEQHRAGLLAGSVDFAVAGRPVPNLRCALSSVNPAPVEVTVMHNTGQAMGSGRLALVAVNPAQGWIDDSMVSEYASGNGPGPLAATYTRPGSYWVTTNVQQKGFCEAALTAGGANLAREPLVIDAPGFSLSMQLTLRDDCASLQLNLPDSQTSITAGDEQSFTVYVVPDFDSTAEVQRVTLRPSTGGSTTIPNLAPGNYHVYSFPGFVEFAYRNRDALQAMRGNAQAVTLSSSATASLQVEVPAQ